jgi:hypothetical protein
MMMSTIHYASWHQDDEKPVLNSEKVKKTGTVKKLRNDEKHTLSESLACRYTSTSLPAAGGGSASLLRRGMGDTAGAGSRGCSRAELCPDPLELLVNVVVAGDAGNEAVVEVPVAVPERAEFTVRRPELPPVTRGVSTETDGDGSAGSPRAEEAAELGADPLVCRTTAGNVADENGLSMVSAEAGD